MSAVQLPAEPIPGFKTQLTLDGKVCVITCSGTLDSPDSTTLFQPKLLQLHDALLAEQFKVVRLDLSQVTYMNSSAIKCFMAWFLRAERAKETLYSIEVIYDPQATWQYVSFTTMGRIAPKVLKMVTQPNRAAAAT